jgi:putative ATPase
VTPLAHQLRPNCLEDFVGQTHLLGRNKQLSLLIQSGELSSMIFWGPTGVGKTTLAHLLNDTLPEPKHFEFLSAVLSGVADIKKVIAAAQTRKRESGQETLLFIDEIHRYNKAQQDALLPFVESGDLILMGATTENPSFALNNALLSRMRVVKLNKLTQEELSEILEQALNKLDLPFELSSDLKQHLAVLADGDARQLLNWLESVMAWGTAKEVDELSLAEFNALEVAQVRRFDAGDELFYEQISALHKSVRGSDPDASLYWLARMLDGGCDPNYIARRLVRMASEDIGNADPRALEITLNAWQAFERLGQYEGDLALAQAVVYLAVAPKSNAVYSAFKQMKKDIQNQPSYDVPMHLRNASTKLMKQLDYGQGYKYAHDYPDAYVPNENYLPEDLRGCRWYQPTGRGLEIKISDKLKRLRALDQSG